MKTGKLAPRHDPRTLTFASYATAALPKPPARDLDNLKRFTDWGMCGNDTVGDCVFAGADHETMNWLATSGSHAAGRLFSDQTAIRDYSAVTGYTPSDPRSDQGTVVIDALNYRRKTGIVDTTGKRHTIAAFVALEHGDTTQLREAAWLFDAVAIGIQFPTSAMDQFDRGRPWSVVPGAHIDGGHYVPVIGYDTRHIYCVTWGRVQPMTWGFYKRYADEAYALLSPEFLTRGRSPEGFDLPALQADLAAL